MVKSPNYAESRCVPQILRCVHHHDWLKMVHMTRLAQFSQQVLLGLRVLGDLTYCIYCPRMPVSSPYYNDNIIVPQAGIMPQCRTMTKSIFVVFFCEIFFGK